MNSISVINGTRTQTWDISKWTLVQESKSAAGEKILVYHDPNLKLIKFVETEQKDVYNVIVNKKFPDTPTKKKKKEESIPPSTTHSYPLLPSTTYSNPEAEKILLNPQLLQTLKNEVAKKVVGEEDSIHTIILTVAGALWIAEQTPPTYTLVTNSKSNAGKDYTVSKTLDLFPPDKIIRRTRISERALTYWHNGKFEPEWTWNNKILYLSDVSNNVLNCEVLKCMITEGSSATIVKDQRAVEIEIKGKPGIVGTIANASPAEETLGRFPFMALNETAEQTKAIMQRQATAAAQGKKLNTEYNKDVLEALKLLEPVTVIIPYAEKLPEHFNTTSVIMRRNFDRILKYIAASAALYQRQRVKDEYGSIIAEPSDYDNAAQALRKIASNAALVPLTREDKEIIEYALTVENFMTTDVAAHVPSLQKTALYEHLDKLSSYGLLKVDTQRQPFGRPAKIYKAASQDVYSIKIPSWKEIDTGGTFSTYSTIPLQNAHEKDSKSSLLDQQNTQLADKSGKSGIEEEEKKEEKEEKVLSSQTILDKFRELWTGKKNWSGKPLSIESVQVLLPEVTDEWIEKAKQHGDIIEHPSGWVMPS